MTPEPRNEEEYTSRQVEAARRVLVDLGQVLASFSDCIVVIGGWVPDLQLPDVDEPHVGSIDVDLALDAEMLIEDHRYAELLKLLLDTKRYRLGAKPFQFVAKVDLLDGENPVQVEVDFLASRDIKFKKNRPPLVEGFRVLQAESCQVAFGNPHSIAIEGKNIRGSQNKVNVRVASLPDFLIMKSHALAGRDKPKDAYDICYCLDHYPDGISSLAAMLRRRMAEPLVIRAIQILHEKFKTVESYGPDAVVEFHGLTDGDAISMQQRRAYELVQALLSELS